VIDLEAAQAKAPKDESDEAKLRRILHSLTLTRGVEVAAKGLSVRAETANLDPKRGVYVLEGDPAVISRNGVRQEARVQILRLDPNQ
jgi:hypothetical protein